MSPWSDIRRDFDAIPNAPYRQTPRFFAAEEGLMVGAGFAALVTSVFLSLTLFLNLADVERAVPWGWGLLLTASSAWVCVGFLGALRLLMNSAPTAEMLTWLREHQREFDLDIPVIPNTKREFSAHVNHAYGLLAQRQTTGSLGEL